MQQHVGFALEMQNSSSLQATRLQPAHLERSRFSIEGWERGKGVLQAGAYAAKLPVAGCNEVPQQCMLGFVTNLVQA